MNVTEHGRKVAVVWRAMHLSAVVTLVGVLAAVVAPDAANGIGIMVGAFVGSASVFTGAYSYAQGKVDERHGPRPSGTMRAVDG